MTSSSLKELEEEIVARLNALPKASTEQIRAVRREFSKRLAKTSPDFIVELALRLLKRSVIRFFAYEIVQGHKEASGSLTARTLAQLGRGIDSWGGVDTFACYLAGPAWREKQVPDSLILRWARSRDRWWRRAALVSTVPLNSKARGGSGDALRTLKICEVLVKDRDEMVVKAMSWSLRELAKRKPKPVRKFLSQHSNDLASRVTREVNNKLITGLKSVRKKTRIAGLRSG